MSRTPLRPQFQTTECGVGVLASMLAWLGRPVSLREIRLVSGVSRDALTAAAIRRAARAFGLDCAAYSVEPDALAGLGLPLVVHMRFIHFVIVESIDATTVRLNCPSSGRIETPRAQFDDEFTGIALRMTAGPAVRAAPATEPSEAAWTATMLRGAWPWLIPALGGTVAAACCVPLFARILATPALPWPARLGLAAASLAGMAAAAWLAHWGRARLRAVLYRRLRARLVAHLAALPDAFYVYRLPEVLFDVVRSLRTVTDELAERLVRAAGAIAAGAALLGGAIGWDPRMGAWFALATVLWGLGVAALCLWRRRAKAVAVDAVAAADAVAGALSRPETVRLAEGADNLRRFSAGVEANRLLARMRLGAIPAMIEAAPSVLTALCLLAVLTFGSALTPAGACGWAGLAIALGVELSPLARLRGVIAPLRQLAFRLRDVLDEPAAPAPPSAPAESVPPGEVRIDAVSYAFTAQKPPVVREVSLHIAPGEQLGLTGPSGGGKSTLAALIAGRLGPTAGRVRAGGRVLRVDRTPVLFAATVRENLTLWDPAIADADLAAATRDAGLDAVLAERPEGLDTMVAPFGRNFSGGQLQRLEIARALARNPAVLILDDAVDALDVATELRLRAALRRRGCAVLLISHRASSLAACDRVLHFAAGQLGEAAPAPPARRAVALSIFDARPLPPPRPVGDDAPALAAAFGAVVPPAALDATALPDTAGMDRAAALACLAAARAHITRVIRVTVPDWWRCDTGPLLGFRRDGAPVAVLPGRAGPVVLDPARGTRTRLDQAAIADLDPPLYGFEPVRRLAASGLRGWMRPILRAGAPEAARAAVCSAVLSLLVLLIPLVLLTPGAAAAVPLLGALAVFWHLSDTARRRMSAAMRRAAASLQADLLLRIDAGAARTLDQAQAWQAIEGLGRLTALLIEAAGAGPAACLTLTGSLAALGWISGSAALAATTTGALLCAAVELLAPVANAGDEAASAAARLSAQRVLASLVWGFSRLRGLGATQPALARWCAADTAWSRLVDRTDRRAGLAAALRLPALLLAVVPAGLAGGPIGAVMAALAVLAGARAGAILGRAVAGARGRAAALSLLGMPRDGGGCVVDTATAVIAAEHVTCRYPATRQPVFADLSLAIDPAAITVLAGPSGGGKSTLLRLLLGLQTPAAGQIRVGGQPIDRIDRAHWYRRIACVFQGDELEQTSTIRGQFPTAPADRVADIWAALDTVELSDEIRAMPMALQTIVQPGVISSGQQQRLLIARALLHQPALLVMDEATNAIQDDLQSRILGRLRERGIGCLIVSHRETVIAAADCVHVIVAGVLAYSGRPEALAARADLTRLLQETEAA